METCSEKVRLFDVFLAATRAHSDAVARLHRVIGTSSKADYDDLYRRLILLRALSATPIRLQPSSISRERLYVFQFLRKRNLHPSEHPVSDRLSAECKHTPESVPASYLHRRSR